MRVDGSIVTVLAKESNQVLQGAQVQKIFQPTPDRVDMRLYGPRGEWWLVFSLHRDAPGVFLSAGVDSPHPMTPPAFCMLLRKYLEGSRVAEVRQAGFRPEMEFVFTRKTEDGGLRYLLLRHIWLSRRGNLTLEDPGAQIVLGALKKGEGPGTEASPRLNPRGLSTDELASLLQGQKVEDVPAILSRKLEGFSQPLSEAVLILAGKSADTISQEAPAVLYIKEIYRGISELIQNLDGQEILPRGALDPATREIEALAVIKEVSLPGEVITFPTVRDAVYQALAPKLQRVESGTRKAPLARLVRTILQRVRRRQERQAADLAAAENGERYLLWGELLKANLHLLRPGMKEFVTANYYDPGMPQVTIPLDPALDGVSNAEALFRRHHKAKTAREVLVGQLETTAAELSYLEQVETMLAEADDPGIIDEIEGELRQEGYLPAVNRRRQKKQAPRAVGPWRYRSSDDYLILVGRNNKQNDQLTLKTASPDDIWFHSQKIPGAHVIVRLEGKGNPPDRTLQEAAAIAAFHSKGASSGRVTVDYTQRKHVRKPAGAHPGMVIYDHFQSLDAKVDEGLVRSLGGRP